jgi:hypothetical protein
MNSPVKTISKRAEALGERITQGALALEAFTRPLTETQWNTPVKGDGRTVGTVTHHVASCYPIETDLALQLASGSPITGATREVIDDMNAAHARENHSPDKEETLNLLHRNSKTASEKISELTDRELETAAPVSLNADAPLTAGFFIEDHALRHSFHHLAAIRDTLSED